MIVGCLRQAACWISCLVDGSERMCTFYAESVCRFRRSKPALSGPQRGNKGSSIEDDGFYAYIPIRGAAVSPGTFPGWRGKHFAVHAIADRLRPGRKLPDHSRY